MKYNIITLCGSTRFKDDFLRVQRDLTFKGNIVLGPIIFEKSDNEILTDGRKIVLSNMHKQKIDMANEIYIINVNGYIGASTRSEIEYAISKGKLISFLEPHKTCYTCRYYNSKSDNECSTCEKYNRWHR